MFIYVHLKLICLSVWYSWISTITCTTDIGYSYQDPIWATTKSKNNKRVGTSIVYIWVDRYKSLTHIQFASDQVC